MIGEMNLMREVKGKSRTRGFKTKFRLAIVITIALWIGLAGLYGLLRPISNGCVMTYMYPTYIPISSPANMSSTKYGLYLYHEGWRKIDFNEHLKKLSGVPVLFIPGNGGSYKQVRSLAAESDRAYHGGPLEHNFYQEASVKLGRGVDTDVAGFSLPSKYTSMLDWFAVDLEGEHSAMDGRILQEHTEYVVYAIHRILDQYKESHDARAKEGSSVSGGLPKSVILVGHSMGGFVARAAVVHPHLKKSAVETVLTLSSPHQSPPVPLQPSLGHYYTHVNQEWRRGYEIETSRSGRYVSDPLLSQVAVISISGGYNDYQVRSKLESLDGIVPSTHGFMISSTSIKNVWLSMEHQVILWCNQLVVQVSHTLLSLIDAKTGHPFCDVRKRLAIFTKMLYSGIPENFDWSRETSVSQQSADFPNQGKKVLSACPSNVWNNDGLEKDLEIHNTTVTVLAMDGRRRWLDIQKLGSNGRKHFVFVTNLPPCFGVRLHLWLEKGNSTSEFSTNNWVIEVTSKMVHIPSGPAPRQVEPGSQTEQAPPSAVLWLDPQTMHGFRFLTISVAPRPTVSGRPPPATSMGVGQFFNPGEGEEAFSSMSMIHSMFSQKEINLEEDHPLAVKLTFSISLGFLPVSLTLRTTGCGIKASEFLFEEPGDMKTGFCSLRCFPPVALAWDATSGLHIYPNLHSETITVDSSPALWTSTQDSEETTVLLLVDPHCSYKTSISVSVTAFAGRFLLLYFSQISGLCVAVVFFALLQQVRSWEADLPIPSLLSAVESNLRIPVPFLFLAVMPTFFALLFSCVSSEKLPPILSFIIVSILCYVVANGAVIVVISISQLVFYVLASSHVFVKKRWQAWEGRCCFSFLKWFINLSSTLSSIKVIRILKANSLLVTALIAIALVFLVHPALGLCILLLSHALCCHNALSSHIRSEELFESGNGINRGTVQFNPGYDGEVFDMDEKSTGSPDYRTSYGETQLEIFYYRHGLLVLHLLATLMFVPSLLAWIQRISIGQNFPWFWDSILCTGVILHGTCDLKPEFDFFLFPVPGIPTLKVRPSFAYLLAGYFTYLTTLALAPYRAFYPMAAIGVVSFAFRIIQRRNREKGETYHSSRKHSHRH